MKPILILATTILITLSLNAQPTWQNRIGGSDTDWAYDIQVLPDGYLISGFSCSPVSGDKGEHGLGEYDFWVVKTDTEGNVLWENTVGGGDTDLLRDVRTDLTNERIWLGGSSRSGISGDKTVGNQGEWDFWAAQTDFSGVLNSGADLGFGGSGTDMLSKILPVNNDRLLWSGYSNSDQSGDKSENGRGGYDFWLLQSDENGTIDWDKTYGSSGDDFLNDVIQTTDGYLLIGWSTGAADNEKTATQFGSGDYWLVKTDQNGNIQWDVSFGGTEKDVAVAGAELPDGSFIISGYSESDISGNKTSASKGGRDFWLVKMDANGNKIWDKSFGGTGDDELNAFDLTGQNNFVLAGSTTSPTGGDLTVNEKGGVDLLVFAVNSDGDIYHDNRFGGSGTDIGTAIVTTLDGYVMSGTTDSPQNGDFVEKSVGWTDYWILHQEVNLVNTKEPIVSTIPKLLVYPNPIQSTMTVIIENPTPGAAELTLFDVTGKAIRTAILTIPSNQSFVYQFDRLDKLSSGVYTLILTQGDGSSRFGKIVK